jgi:hypothetical protein
LTGRACYNQQNTEHSDSSRCAAPLFLEVSALSLFVYAITLFVSAFLLFLVQPIIGQKILPKLGGTPSVWNTCVVFFQVTLLIGYAYTHFTTRLPVRRQILIHCLLLFVPFLILLPNGPFPVEGFKPVTGGNPILQTLIFLAMIVGIPFFVVSTTAPLLQKWFGSTGHPAAKDPYFLYGASNLGSMLSLLLYPVLFEPLMGLSDQSWFYTAGYVVLVGMVIGCAVMALTAPPSVQLKKRPEEPEHVPSLAPEPPPEPTELTAPSAAQITPAPSTAVSSTPLSPAPKPAATGIKKGGKHRHKHRDRDLAKVAPTAVAPGAAAAIAPAPAPMTAPSIAKTGLTDVEEITPLRKLRWIGLAAVPSSLMLGVTTYMSTDISAIPLFWVLPLALYLLSFILVFMRSPINWIDQAHEYVLYVQPALLALLAVFMAISGAPGVVYMILIMLAAFTATCLACHGEMARDRPSAKHLTEFYLLMSVGGAIGGLFNGIIAPLIFSWGIVEFGLALVIAGLLRPWTWEPGWLERLFANMTEPKDAAKHHHSKSGKKIVKTTEETPALPIILDIAVPLALAGLMFLLLNILPGSRSFSGAEAIFYCLIVPAICAACFFARPIRFGLTLAALLLVPSIWTSRNEGDEVRFTTRSYFGLLRVRHSKQGFEGTSGVEYNSLMHGTTHHGMALGIAEDKNRKYDLTRVATTYYHRQGPVGICMERFNWFPKEEYWDVDYLFNFNSDTRAHLSLMLSGAPALGPCLPVTQLVGLWAEPAYCTIGLGTGTMATYARPTGTLHFYEIDEQIKQLSLPTSGGETYFGYLKAALGRGANVKILMGDARLRMAMPWIPAGISPDTEAKDIPFDLRGGPENFYHLMVVDAFSSDAIPRHLITKQAMEMYFRHLVQGRWGQWLEVSTYKDESGQQWEVDQFNNRIDPQFFYEEEKNSEGKVTKKRPWIPGGVLCVHTSNRHLRLVPVVVDTAAAVEWDALWDKDYADGKTTEIKYAPRNADGTRQIGGKGCVANRGHDQSPGQRDVLNKKSDIGHFTSEWVIVARDPKDIKHLKPPAKYNEWIILAAKDFPRKISRDEPYWQLQSATGTYVWTDDHTNLMAVFRWPWDH